jgi:hypothetical protein
MTLPTPEQLDTALNNLYVDAQNGSKLYQDPPADVTLRNGAVVANLRKRLQTVTDAADQLGALATATAVAEAAAAEAAALATPYASRATAQAATVMAGVNRIAVLDPTVGVLNYYRDVNGTALSTNSATVNWSPVAPVYAQHFGVAPGASESTNSAALTAALTAAGNGPVLVPYSDTPYDMTALTPQQRQRLYGPGDLRVSGVQQWINSNPYVGTDVAPLRVINLDWQPDQWVSVNGSLFNGAMAARLTRTGGWPTYGIITVDSLISAATATGFDSGITAWMNHQNQTGAMIVGGWFAASGGRTDLGQTHSAGAVVGLEANAYIADDVGLQADIGGAKYSVGIQSVPDACPRRDAARGPVRPGSFAFVAGDSIHGDRWHTGYLVSADTIMPGGIASRLRGGSVLGNAPSHMILADGFYTNGAVFSGTFTDAIAVTGTGQRGINLASATIAGSAILLAANHLVSWGGATISGGTKGLTQSIGAGVSAGAADDWTVYANAFANRLLWARWTGAAEVGFLGATPSPRITLPANATDPATTMALTNAIRSALIAFGLCA